MMNSFSFVTSSQGERELGGQRKEGNRNVSKNHRYNKILGRSDMKMALKLPLTLSKAILTRAVKLR